MPNKKRPVDKDKRCVWLSRNLPLELRDRAWIYSVHYNTSMEDMFAHLLAIGLDELDRCVNMQPDWQLPVRKWR